MKIFAIIPLFLVVYSCNSSNSSSDKKADCSSAEAEKYAVETLERQGWVIESSSLLEDDQNCNYIFRINIAGMGCKHIEIYKSSGEYHAKSVKDCQ
jgi:hypothetical protein